MKTLTDFLWQCENCTELHKNDVEGVNELEEVGAVKKKKEIEKRRPH